VVINKPNLNGNNLFLLSIKFRSEGVKGDWVCVFENSVLRRIFGTRNDEITGEWRNMQSGVS
jgi:hypothetical protein